MSTMKKSLYVVYDEDYGIDKRSGWSVAIDGSYYVQFEEYLIKAIVKAIYEWVRLYDKSVDE